MFANYLPVTGKLYGDSTDQLLAISTSDNKCILIVSDYDFNSIHVQGMHSGTKQSQVKAYDEAMSLLKKRGCILIYHYVKIMIRSNIYTTL